MEFLPILLSAMAEDLAACCFAPDVLKQFFKGRPKNALYMINLEKSQDHFIHIVCTQGVIFNAVHAR